MTQKRTTTVRRNGRNSVSRSPARRKGSRPEARSAGRRFAPSLRNVTDGGIIYGALVANHRTRLGLTQKELAARVRISPSSVERIEQGHPPDAEIREKLAAIFTLDQPSPIRWAVTKLAPSGQRRRRHLSLGSRWLWGGVAMVAIALLALAVGSIAGSGGTASSRQPSVAVSQVLGAPASIHHARVHAEKIAAAEARRAAERRREREAAAAAAAAAAAEVAATKAAAKEARQNASTTPEPVATPVQPPPAPSGGGGGGSGSSGAAPELQHGIGAGGGVGAP